MTLSAVYQMDNSVLSDYQLPDGMNRDLCTHYLLDHCGGNEVRYSDPEHLHAMINYFFESYAYKYEKLWETVTLEYDLLLNFDLTTEEQREITGNTDRSGNSSADATITNTRSAFNSSTYQPDNRQASDSGSEFSENEDESRTEKFTSRVYGDNSARSTQYNIQEQRNLVDFNIYRVIAEDFEPFITIPVY